MLYPEVSIIIPTCNRRYLLEQTLKSALAQDFCEFEIVVVNNASSDTTHDFLATIRDPKIRIYEQPYRVSMQQNVWSALHRARGRFAIILSDDDLLEPEFLRVGMGILALQSDPLFFTANYNQIDLQGNPVGQRSFLLPEGLYHQPHLFFKKNVAGLCATLFPLDMVKRIGFVDNIFFDWTWWNSLCLSGLSVFVSSCQLASYRIHPSSITVESSDMEYAKATRDMYQFLLQRFGYRNELYRLYHDVEARVRYWESRQDHRKLWPFVTYTGGHLSFETVKLLMMRCMPLRTVTMLRLAFGRASYRDKNLQIDP